MRTSPEIPQATIRRIRSVIDAVASGAHSVAEIGAKADISYRQAGYGTSAAQLLGLIESDDSGTFRLTSKGSELSKTLERTSAERTLLVRAIESNPLITKIAPGLLHDKPPSREQITRNIVDQTSISANTAAHRAGMLLKWRELLTAPPSRESMVDKPMRTTSGPPAETPLTTIEIENFKSIKSVSLRLEPLMVFVGPNGAGKTNLIQGISAALDLIEEASTEPLEILGGYDQLIRRGRRRSRYMRFSVSTPLRPLVVRRSKNGEDWADLSMTVDVVLKPGPSTEQAHVESEEVFIRKKGRDWIEGRWKKGKLDKFDKSDDAPVERSDLERFRGGDPTALNSGWIARRLSSRPLSALTRLRLDASALRADSQLTRTRHGRVIGTTGEGLPLAIERLRNLPVFKRIIAGLREVYPRIEAVDTIHLLPGQVALRFKEAAIEEGLGQANVSDGVMHALALLVALETSGPLAIEEPENAIHPWALRKIVERAQERESQAPLLITTHSPTVVDCIRDPASLYIVENSVTNGTTIAQATQQETALRSILKESGQRLGDVWLDGSLGGVPEE